MDIIPTQEAHINKKTSATYGTPAYVTTPFRNLNQESFKAIYTTFIRKYWSIHHRHGIPHL